MSGITIKRPRILDAQMRERGQLHPSRMKQVFNLHTPHTAQATLPPQDADLRLRDWVELYNADGSAGIFRVSSMDPDFGVDTRVGFTHGICVLSDDTVKLGTSEIEDTVGGFLTRFWSATGVDVTPSYWQLGTLAETPKVKYQPGADSLLQAVQAVMQKAKGFALEFDQTSFPWTLNLVQLSDENPCEGRFRRNMDGVQMSIDDEGLYTRVYLDDRTGYTDADTIDTWGVISTTLTVPDNATNASVKAYVADYLEAHKEPAVSIEASGEDLSAITGEDLDALRLGRMCRACLPDYNTTISERIIRREIPDVYGDPLGVRLSMANKVEETADLLVLTDRETKANTRSGTVASRRITGAVKRIEAVEGYFDRIVALEADIGKLNTKVATIEKIFAGDVKADWIRVTSLSAEQATIDRLFVNGSSATWKDLDDVSKVIGR